MAKPKNKSALVLDPLERTSEILFGLIMVLTFTSSVRVAHTGHGEIREMLIAALGCNLAWGLIDGMMYMMSNLSERGHNFSIVRAVHAAPDEVTGRSIIKDALPPVVYSVLPDNALEHMRLKLKAMQVPHNVRLTADDWRGAAGVFLLVFASTFPVVVPFIFATHHLRMAMHLSDAIAITLLMLTGYSYGSYADNHPWRWSLSMVLVGAGMVGLCHALGG